MNKPSNNVSVKEEIYTFPTYLVTEPNPNPMFLEKRIYQGSSGVVYPHPIIDSVSTTKVNQDYRVVILENDFIKIMVMPELGGRIQMAYDKQRDYHFVYFNQVIKPALVGLAGPWISGGIEFNWPQHHRPSTFDPLQYKIIEHSDGSATLWVGEVERMFRTYGIAGITLHPDRASIEITGKLYNPTQVPQTFLWWANPAVKVNDSYQSIFPPDVHAVFDHGKRDVSEFPIARGTYYKIDYSKGVDISWYKNIPVPTSYMAYHSDFDFVGGYDHNLKSGILHVADHHVSPGKKMWTWGNGDFAQAWEKNLTDEDGPYIELMTGVFTDNQPDFSWIMPGEYKEFTQHFMPYGDIPQVCCANEFVIIGLEEETMGEKNHALLSIYSPRKQHLLVRVEKESTSNQEEISVLTTINPSIKTWSREWMPGEHETYTFTLESGSKLEDYRILIFAESGQELLSYRKGELKGKPVPESAKGAQKPKDIPTIDQLYLKGLHIEQYRHATRDPELYYLEGLNRDSGDLQCNMAMGLRRFKSGDFQQARYYLELAVQRENSWNTNGVHSESLYYLGLCQLYQEDLDKALSNFGKASWSRTVATSSLHNMAVIYTRQKKFDHALQRVHQALTRDPQFIQARFLQALLFQVLGKSIEAKEELQQLVDFYPLYFPALAELQENEYTFFWCNTLAQNGYTLLEVALEYRFLGFSQKALNLVNLGISFLDKASNSQELSQENSTSHSLASNPLRASKGVLPLLYYLQGNLLWDLGKSAESSLQKAEQADYRYCFPNQLEFVEILEWAITLKPNSSRALYYLGCLLYDKRRHRDAHRYWEQSVALAPEFVPVLRNIALSFFNKKKDSKQALACLRKAVELAPEDPRLVFELNALLKKTQHTPEIRKKLLESLGSNLTKRDDLSLEYVSILNLLGDYPKALEILSSRQFQPWEGGEGKVPIQYKIALIGLAKEALVSEQFETAEILLHQALDYPDNLGEGKLPNTPDNEIHYFLGWLHQAEAKLDLANKYYQLATKGEDTPTLSLFYNDTPADALFYRGLAYARLEEIQKAEEIFTLLVDYGQKHLQDTIEIDYFAVSLPEFLVFDDDLTRNNKVFCHFLIGLGNLGIATLNMHQANLRGSKNNPIMTQDSILEVFTMAIELDPAHYQTKVHVKLMDQWALISDPKVCK